MCYDHWALIVNIFVAIGTIGAVVVVIYKDLFIAWRNRPIISCELENPTLYSTKDEFKPIYYCRFVIRNTGKSSLKTVEVMITDLKKEDGDQFVKVESFSPDNLIWSFLDQIYCPFISPGTSQLCNLGHITDKATQDFKNEIFELNVRFKSRNLHYLLPEGLYRAEITVGAENAKAEKKYYEINISKSEPKDKFLIKEISKNSLTP